MIERVSLAEAAYIAHRMARELMDYGEPVADFHMRYPGKLESCLEQPFTHLNGRYVYWTLYHRAAMLFYLLIKNHPFENGNKRMAVTVMLTFLYKNHKWITISPNALYGIARDVADSDAKDKDIVVATLKRIFKQHSTAL